MKQFVRKFPFNLLVIASFTIAGWLWNVQSTTRPELKDGYAYAAPLKDFVTNIPILINNVTEETIFGVEMYKMTVKGGLDKMNEAGTTWVRHNDFRDGPDTDALIWTAVEPNKGDRNWSMMAALETQLLNASSRGQNVILTVRSTPAWARDPRWPNSPCGPIDPNHYSDFANFMFDVVKRYSVSPYNVKHWEIYNEPDYPINTIGPPYGEPHGCWGTFQIEGFNDPYNNGRAYGELLKVVYPKIKQADPEAQVITGGVLLDCDPREEPPGSQSQCERRGKDVTFPKFFEGVLVSGAGNSFDGVSFHSYEYYPYWFGDRIGQYVNDDWATSWNTTGPVLVAKVEYLNQLLQQYSVFGKALYSTESAVLHPHDDFKYNHGICKPYNLDYEYTKASNLVQTYTYSKALGLRTNIYFHVYGWRCSALLEDQNTPVQPAYDAYSFAAEKMGYATFVREITAYPNVRVFEFQYFESETKFWIIWSLDGADHLIELPFMPSVIWDMTGNIQPVGGQNYNVTIIPHYIEF